jgi:predicted translin family RNA/ssDNA-binding protein
MIDPAVLKEIVFPTVAFIACVAAIGVVVRWILVSLRRSTLEVPEDLVQHFERLHAELGQIRSEMADVGERMDFVERVLVKRSDPERIAPGS